MTHLLPDWFQPSLSSSREGEGLCQLPTRTVWGSASPQSSVSARGRLGCSRGQPRAGCEGLCRHTPVPFPSPAEADTAPGARLNQTGRGPRPLQPASRILHLESAASRAPEEAVCFASSIPGPPWQLGEDGHTVLPLCSRTALQILLASLHFCRRE